MSASLRIALTAAALVAAGPLTMSAVAAAQAADTCARHAPEAAVRSGLSVDIVLRVMAAESRGWSRAVSPKGAMGCMQIMPGTWAYLTRRYGLGSDPYDPRMNMTGGALYLAELARQFGFPGAWSAYNAGPGRYIRHVQDGAPLPAETVAYTARISGGASATGRAPVAGQPPVARWQEAGLFTRRPDIPATASATPDASEPAPRRPSDPLFPLRAPPRTDDARAAGS